MSDLQKFAENIWTIDGPPIRNIGIPLPTRMIVVKLVDGSLWINSPVSTPPRELARLVTLGSVRYLVAPTKLHLWRLEEWHQLFQDAELWAPPQPTKKFKHLPFAGILGDAPPHGWAEDFDQVILEGNCLIREVAFLHKRSRTVILTDFIQNHPIRSGRPVLNILWRLAGVAYPPGGVPVDIRWSFTDRELARRSLAKLLSWEFDQLIIAHGVCIRRNAKPFVEQAFRWLLR